VAGEWVSGCLSVCYSWQVLLAKLMHSGMHSSWGMLSPPPTEPRQVVSWYPSNGYMHTGREKTDSERKEASSNWSGN